MRASWDLALEEMRKWDHSSVFEEDSPREDLEGGLTSGRWQLEARWGEGNSLWAVWASSRIRGPDKAAQIRRKGMRVVRESRMRGWGGAAGEQGHCKEHTWSESWHQNVRKNAAFKESLQIKVSRPRTKFNGRLKLPGWLGKDGTVLTLG
jgi:hypothetical protein